MSQPETLLTEDVLPVIDAIVRRRCRGDLVSIGDEVRGEVFLRLLRRSRMASPDEIHSVRDYAAAVTWRVIDDLIRQRFPRRTQLKNRIRYLIRCDQRFVCTVDDDGTLCSLAGDALRRSDRHSAEVEDLARHVSAVLQRRSPCEIDELVSRVAEELGISDAQVPADDAGVFTAERETPLSRAEAADSVRVLWKEILLLPPKQRLALLLSMRDEREESPLALLPLLAIASVEDIADSLGLMRHDFESMIHRLPLQDLEIAAMLAVTQQQVINLRKAARDRLRRLCSAARSRHGALMERSSMENRFTAAVLDEHDHLDATTLESYAADALTAAEERRVREHARVCERCAAELEDLRSFARGFSLRPRMTRVWIAAAAAIAAAIVVILIPRPIGQTGGTPPVSIRDGSGVITLDASGRVHGAPAPWSSEIASALRAGRLRVKPSPFASVPQGDILRGASAPSGFRVLQPVDAVVADAKPQFEWTAAGSKPSYVVEIFDGQFDRVTQSPRIPSTRWRPEQPLPRAVNLQWQVVAIQDGGRSIAPQPPAQPARLFIVDARSANRIEAARATKSHLANAIAYAAAGMRDSARAELERLAAQNPGSTAVSRLLRSLTD